jgi:hypothetical protein
MVGTHVQVRKTPKLPQRDDRHDRAAAAAYISELCTDLASIARGNGFETLGYLLDMARLEANSSAGTDTLPGSSPS